MVVPAGPGVEGIGRARSASFGPTGMATVPDQDALEKVLSSAGEKWLEAHAAGRRDAKSKIEAQVRNTELELERMEESHAHRNQSR